MTTLKKRRTLKITEAQRKEICSQYLAGGTTYKLASEYNVAPQHISRILEQEGVGRRHAAPKLTDAQRASIPALYAAGETSSSLAKQFGVSGAIICRILKRQGVVLPARPNSKVSLEQWPAIVKDYQCGATLKTLSAQYGVSKTGIIYILRQCSVPGPGPGKSRKYECDQSYFENLDLESVSYWLGFIAADGNVDKRGRALRITLAAKDADHLKRFLADIKSEHPIHYESRVTSRRSGRIALPCDCASISIGSKEIVESLGKVGITPNKTLTLQWPRLSDESLRHFLRGYFDGDGCWNVHRQSDMRKPSLHFSVTGNTDFLSDCQQFLIKACKLKQTAMNSVGAGGRVQVLQYGGNLQTSRIADFLYQDATIYLPRKLEIARPFLSSSVRVAPTEPLL